MKYMNQKGSVLLLMVITIPFLFALSALAVDIGALYSQRAHMQNIADAAALAGAQELPGSTAAATEKVKQYITANNQSNNVLKDGYPVYSEDNSRIDVRLKKTVSTIFLGMFNFSPPAAEVVAAAKATSAAAIPADYAIISRDTRNLVLGGGDQFIGSVYTGGNLEVANNANVTASVSAAGNLTLAGSAKIAGNASAGGDITANNSARVTGNVIAGGAVKVDQWMLDQKYIDPANIFSSQTNPLDGFNAPSGPLDQLFVQYDSLAASVKAKAISNKNEYNGDLVINTQAQVSQYLNGPLYVNGNITINDPGISKLIITAAIIAKGTITIAKNAEITGVDGLAIYSETGAVSITNNVSINGLIYAPKGSFSISGGGNSFKGGIVANTILSLGGGGSTFSTENGGNNGGGGGSGKKAIRLVL